MTAPIHSTPEMTGDFEALEEVAGQTSIRVNKKTRMQPGWSVGPNIERSSVHAEHKPKPQRAPAMKPEVILPVLVPDEVIAVIRRHQDFTEVFRAMKERLGLSNEFIEKCGDMAPGHIDKIFGPSGAKNWGPTTFDFFCELLGIEFHAKIDLDAVKRMEGVWEKRKRAPTENSRISRKLIEKAKPHVLQGLAKCGNDARNAMLTGEHKSRIARKAAKSRWRKERATARQAPCATSSPASRGEPGRS